jgi:hypothetical protein
VTTVVLDSPGGTFTSVSQDVRQHAAQATARVQSRVFMLLVFWGGLRRQAGFSNRHVCLAKNRSLPSLRTPALARFCSKGLRALVLSMVVNGLSIRVTTYPADIPGSSAPFTPALVSSCSQHNYAPVGPRRYQFRHLHDGDKLHFVPCGGGWNTHLRLKHTHSHHARFTHDD